MSLALTPVATRRAVLALGTAGMVLAVTKPLSAKRTFEVPQVDQLSLQVIVDSATFGPFLENQTRPGMKVLFAGNSGIPTPRMLPRALLGEFGLSILGESTVGEQRRRIMVDFGYSKEALKNNLDLLGIDPATVDGAVLSHGHLDHYGGFAGLYREGAKLSRHIPLIVGGEEVFCERTAMIGQPPPIMGSLDRAALTKAGFDVAIRAEPAVIADHAFTTGIIPLNSFERAAIPTRMRPGVGCELAGLNVAKQTVTELADDGEHELATCYAVKGLGLVVIASCSHRGVINSVRRAQSVSGIKKVHAVIGGFHLVRPRTDEEAKRTVAELAAIDPNYIIPMHCTGETFIAEAQRIMPQKIVRPYVGTKFIFSAAG